MRRALFRYGQLGMDWERKGGGNLNFLEGIIAKQRNVNKPVGCKKHGYVLSIDYFSLFLNIVL